MITTTLLANGATVYIIGPKQADLDKWVVLAMYDAKESYCSNHRIAKVYNDAAEKTNRPGRIYGIEGDVRKKVWPSPLHY